MENWDLIIILNVLNTYSLKIHQFVSSRICRLVCPRPSGYPHSVANGDIH